MSKKSAIVVGAGIVGLATARALSLKGYIVTVIERSEKALGASIRNFGMIWPVGQPDGTLYNRALRSKMIWKDIADSIGLWYDETGSSHVAYYEDEWQVLQEVHNIFLDCERPVQLMNNGIITGKFNGVNPDGLMGGLYSDTEMVIEPREAMTSIPIYLNEYLDVQFIWGKTVTAVESGKVYMNKDEVEADIIFICSGADFETLYREEFSSTEITKCKLQMMRFKTSDEDFNIGTSLCGGLSLIHYNSFTAAPSLPKLRERYQQDMAEYLQWGIHVMVAQNSKGELAVGDSHEYGLTFDPFDQAFINNLITNYLQQFALTDNWQLIQTWNGIYSN
jgi:FAD dependent oxidoreductase TIGR03364